MNKAEIFKLVAATAARSPAARRKVGAVLVWENQVVCTGFNHNPCADRCEDDDGNTLSSVMHAEEACLRNYALRQNKPSLAECTMYVSHQPCVDCETQLAAQGVKYEVVEEFLKFDAEKLRYDLVPPSAVKAMADVLTFGARKYKPNNWKNCQDPERYLAALIRHIEAYRSGEELDTDSGLPHLAHAMTNLAFLLELGYVPQEWNK